MRIEIKKTGFVFEASPEWVEANMPSDKYAMAEADPVKVELIKQLLKE